MWKKQNMGLLSLLQQNEALKAKGFSLGATHVGGIVIDRSGHVRGIWDFDGRDYTWTSPGSSERTFRVAEPEAAVSYTLTMLGAEGQAA